MGCVQDHPSKQQQQRHEASGGARVTTSASAPLLAPVETKSMTPANNGLPTISTREETSRQLGPDTRLGKPTSSTGKQNSSAKAVTTVTNDVVVDMLDGDVGRHGDDRGQDNEVTALRAALRLAEERAREAEQARLTEEELRRCEEAKARLLEERVAELKRKLSEQAVNGMRLA